MSAGIVSNIRTTLEMIKIEHTLFALPFALLGAVLAARGLPSFSQILWIAVAMVGARSTAMAFNRVADKDYDARNPRTKMRAIPAGQLSVVFVLIFTIVGAGTFLFAAAMLNRLTLILSPVALASIMLYSYTKRWTTLSHIVLGWCLAIAPTGAWIAVRGTIDSPAPLLLSLVVLLWTAGFDVLYACQDYRFRSPRRFVLNSGAFWHRARALDLARAARGSIRRAGFAILRNEPGFAGYRRRNRYGCFARLPAHAGARERSEQTKRGVFYDQCFCERDPVSEFRQRGALSTSIA